jgi:hypothetical protein
MSRSTVAALAFCTAGALIPATAQAHFMLNSPTSWHTQTTDGSPQKTAPCGNEAATGTAASGVVTNFQPGQTVNVSVTSTIAHPGWWRISLRQGASSTQTAAAFPDPAPLGAAGSAQQCTPAFIDNPVWSTTQPVLLDRLGIPAGSNSTTTNQSGTKMFTVTIPSNANCTSAPCTLQVLMFMTDHPAGMCNYHHCADITVGATGTGGMGGAGGASGGRGGAAGGMAGRGGMGGRGGTTGAGGGAGTTGAGGSGGTTGAGGTSATGTAGTTGTGGSDVSGTGGDTGAGGTSVSGAGGDTGAGGATGAGGSSTTGTGGSSATGTGATGGGGADGGCSCAVGQPIGALPALLMAIAVIAGRRRTRRR